MRLEQKRKIYDKVITGFDLIFVRNNEFSIGMAYTYIALRNIDLFDKQYNYWMIIRTCLYIVYGKQIVSIKI